MQKNTLLVFTAVATGYAPRRFSEESRKSGIGCTIVTYSEIDFVINKDSISATFRDGALPPADMVIFRSPGTIENDYTPQRNFLMKHYKRSGARILNYSSYSKWPTLDKVTQHIIFSEGGAPFIETKVFSAAERLRKWAENANYPYIFKAKLGSKGRDVYKVDSKEDVGPILSKFHPTDLLIQPYLKGGWDIRVIVVGGKCLGAMKRIAKEDGFLSNYSQGGSVERYELDDKIKQIAEKTSLLFDLDYCGVDLMKSGDEWFVLEVNRACQFEGFEKATSLDVAKSVIDYLSR